MVWAFGGLGVGDRERDPTRAYPTPLTTHDPTFHSQGRKRMPTKKVVQNLDKKYRGRAIAPCQDSQKLEVRLRFAYIKYSQCNSSL